MNKFHTPVLVSQIISYFDPRPDKKFIDVTLGGGGHSSKLLQHGAKVLGIDHDQEAIDYCQNIFSNNKNITLAHGNFTNLKEISQQYNFNQVDGIIFDLGVSSHQLDSQHRGFSFRKNNQLDMRMDSNLQVTAKDLITALSEKELSKLFFQYSDEVNAKKIARAIINQRKISPISNTKQLARLVENIYKKSYQSTSKIHPATKVFQALRIAVNDEINNLDSALVQTINLLKPNAKLAVISFHSIEDKITKNFIRNNPKTLTNLTKKPITPNQLETNINPRASSAKLRVAAKII